jgi:hypothetical protein
MGDLVSVSANDVPQDPAQLAFMLPTRPLTTPAELGLAAIPVEATVGEIIPPFSTLNHYRFQLDTMRLGIWTKVKPFIDKKASIFLSVDTYSACLSVGKPEKGMRWSVQCPYVNPDAPRQAIVLGISRSLLASVLSTSGRWDLVVDFDALTVRARLGSKVRCGAIGELSDDRLPHVDLSDAAQIGADVHATPLREALVFAGPFVPKWSDEEFDRVHVQSGKLWAANGKAGVVMDLETLKGLSFDVPAPMLPDLLASLHPDRLAPALAVLTTQRAVVVGGDGMLFAWEGPERPTNPRIQFDAKATPTAVVTLDREELLTTLRILSCGYAPAAAVPVGIHFGAAGAAAVLSVTADYGAGCQAEYEHPINVTQGELPGRRVGLHLNSRLMVHAISKLDEAELALELIHSGSAIRLRVRTKLGVVVFVDDRSGGTKTRGARHKSRGAAK